MLMRWPSALGSICLTMTACSAEQDLKGGLSNLFREAWGANGAY